ncbi:MAG: 2TM domain-containing protein [Solirubrobacterales bacterium]
MTDTPMAPEQGIQTAENARELAIARLKMKQDFKGVVGGGALAVIVTVVIWALSDGGYFWPMWVMLGVAIGVVVQGWKAYGPSNQITEDDVQREMQRR